MTIESRPKLKYPRRAIHNCIGDAFIIKYNSTMDEFEVSVKHYNKSPVMYKWYWNDGLVYETDDGTIIVDRVKGKLFMVNIEYRDGEENALYSGKMLFPFIFGWDENGNPILTEYKE